MNLNKKGVIIITKRQTDIHVCLKDNPAIWGCGKSQYEAIGSMVAAHPEWFCISEIKSK